MQMNDAEYLRQVAEDLDNIAMEIDGLIQSAGRLLRGDRITSDAWEKARGQWFANIVSSVHPHSEWVGGSMVKMTDTINLLRDMADEVAGEPEEDFYESLMKTG